MDEELKTAILSIAGSLEKIADAMTNHEDEESFVNAVDRLGTILGHEDAPLPRAAIMLTGLIEDVNDSDKLWPLGDLMSRALRAYLRGE